MAQHQYSNDLELTSDTSLPQEEEAFLRSRTENLHHLGSHPATVGEKRRLWWRKAVINTLFIFSWFFFATILSVYNKWMFSETRYGFPAPLFVTTMHMLVQFALAALLRFTWPSHFRPVHVPTREEYGKSAVPTAVATSMDIGLSNLSLKTITLSFYTMCKSSSLIFVLLFAFLFRLEVYSWRLVAVILLIFSGVLLMVATETHFILHGFILVISASAMGGLRWSLTQIMLKNKKMGFDNPAATIYWLSPTMGLSLAIVSVVVENWASLFRSEFFTGFTKILETMFFLSAPGIVAFCMVLSEFYIIQRTGVVPMSIAGIAKEVTTISISAWFFGDQLTPLNIVGVAITVCGIGLFTFHKYRKSLETDVSVDAHGNPVSSEGDVNYAEEAGGTAAEAGEENIRLTSEVDGLGERGARSSESSVLFSAADEEGDEIRSLGSRWGGGEARSRVLEEASGLVARESLELERIWTRR